MSDANKIRYGIQDVHVAPVTISNAGVITYGTPVRVPGARSITMDPEGDITAVYADNGVYYRAGNNNGYSGSLEFVRIPDWFRKQYLNETQDSNGVIIEQSSKNDSKYFALLFQFEGDKKAVRHVLYYCTCSRPSVSSSTKEASLDPQFDTLNITADPRPKDYIVKARSSEDTNSETYNGWYTQVYVPTVDSNGDIQVVPAG